MADLTLEQQQALALAQARRLRAEAEGGAAPVAKPGPLGSGVAQTVDDSVSGVGSGIPFSDEIEAGIAAPFRAIARKVKAGDWQAPGLSDIADAYNTEKTGLDKRRSDAGARSPVATTVGAIAGGVMATPTLPGAAPATWAGRAGKAALESGAYGALYGAGEGEGLKDRSINALIGGGTGLAAGGILTPAAETLVKGGQKAAAIYRGIRNPEEEASRQLGHAIGTDRAMTAGNELPDRGLTNKEFDQGVAENTPLWNVERGAANTRALADSVASRSPEARNILVGPMHERTRGQFGRIEDDLNSMVPGHTDDVIEALNARARLENEPRYDAAHSHPNAQSMWDNEFARLTGARFTQDAIKKAVIDGTNDAVRKGARPVRTPFGVHKDTGELYLANPNVAPNLAFWDSVKRKMDDAIGPLVRAGEKNAVGAATDIKNQLISHLDRLTEHNGVSLYGEARSGAAAFIKAGNAAEAGEKVVTDRSLSPQAVFKMYAKMSPSERSMARIGAVNTLKNKLGNVKDSADLTGHLFADPNSRARIGILLGDQNMGKLGKRLELERAMQISKSDVTGNSKTFQRLAQGALGTVAGGASLVDDGDTSPWEITKALATGGAAAYLGGKGMHHYDKRLATAIARKLASADPNEFKAITRQLSQNPKLRAAVRAIMAPLSIAGIQAPF